MRHTLTQPLPGTVVDPLYPDEDSRPMGDTDYHSIAIVSLRQGLEDFFRDWDDVYVGMNLPYPRGQITWPQAPWWPHCFRGMLGYRTAYLRFAARLGDRLFVSPNAIGAQLYPYGRFDAARLKRYRTADRAGARR